MALNTNTSVVDYLKSIGKDSSYNNRTTLASQNKIAGYAGTEAQNIQLLNALKASQAKAVTPKVVAPVVPKVTTPKVTTPTNTKTAGSPATTPTTALPTAPAFDQAKFLSDMQNQINGMYDAQKQSQLATLQAQRDKAVGDINLQIANTAPEYAQKKNEADVISAQGVKRLSELIASQGLTGSGENITAQTAQNNQRQNSLNTLNLQEQQQLNDYQKRIADLNNPADAEALSASLDAQRSQALLDAYNRANDVGYQRSTDQRNFDYQKGLDTWNQNHTTQRDTTGDQQWQKTFDQNAKTTAQDQAWRKYTFDHMSAADKSQLAWAKQQYGEDAAWRMYELKYNGNIQIGTNQAQINALTP